MSNDENEDSATWTSNATKPKLTPCEKTKNSKRIKFSQLSSEGCNDINFQVRKENTAEIAELSNLLKTRDST
jgi:hypothetical protein